MELPYIGTEHLIPDSNHYTNIITDSILFSLDESNKVKMIKPEWILLQGLTAPESKHTGYSVIEHRGRCGTKDERNGLDNYNNKTNSN